MQAPVPYLNRALAEEQLGVDADEQSDHQQAQEQYEGAVKVLLLCYDVLRACVTTSKVSILPLQDDMASASMRLMPAKVQSRC